MRTRAVIVAAVTGVLLLVCAGAVYAYDHARAKEIGKGVRVGGVDVSGLTTAQARAKLRSAVLEPLSRPVVVRVAGKHFTLTPERARVGIDIDGSVRAAMARTREGNLFQRAWRDLRGKKVDANVDLDISYSKHAIDRLVKRVESRVDKPAVNASVDLEHGHVAPVSSKEGRRVLANRLKRQVRRRLLDTGSDKTVLARTKEVVPKVTTKDLAKRYPAIIVVNRSAFKLTLYKDLKPAKTYGIAVGQVGLETPAGLYHVENKAVNPAWHVPNSAWAGSLAGQVIPGGVPSNPIRARWMGIFDGAGIHGTTEDASIGSAASHGCIRMHIPDVIELYDQVPVGAPVYIS
jgi:lipoprotein-anchoring transpeptidase ErfK/SrfK